MTESRLADLSSFKTTIRVKNIVGLMQSELRGLNGDISWAKEVLNAQSKD
jgi:hypothetical protein